MGSDPIICSGVYLGVLGFNIIFNTIPLNFGKVGLL